MANGLTRPVSQSSAIMGVITSFFVVGGVQGLLLTTRAMCLLISRFWHITDVHYDNTYFTSQLSCNDDVPSPGPYGDYWCDSPWRLVQSTVDFMADKTRELGVDFVIWTGDTIAHIKNEDTSLDENLVVLHNVSAALEAGLPGIPVYASLGNHDFFPDGQAEANVSEIYQAVGDMWRDWISNQAQVQRFENGGFYATAVRNAPKLRLLALNTNLYYHVNKVTAEMADPAGQFQWMKGQLQEAKASGQKVIITGHVPAGLLVPGAVDWFHPRHKKSFVQILFDHSDVIAATHFGHDHHDGFKVLQKPDGSGAVSQFTAPSVTPWRYRIRRPSGDEVGNPHNPAVRLVEYDRDTGEHLDYHQYFINLTDTNTQNRANWAKLYSFKEAYAVPDMSVNSIKVIYDRVKDGEGKDYTDQFCRFSLVSALEKPCEDRVRGEIYCGGIHHDKTKVDNCVEDYLKRVNHATPATRSGLGFFVPVLITLSVLIGKCYF
ncbi:acid sphingomyelinase-like phosphodiesterase 3b [Elysia marginata]|uniref:Acid sphingomyelinase-like phosphodiesterase 3b n=1 Tax=Elysia marginata TaxID=1093978 RepID=A0AAV4JEY1_9GAST|nr:acid sphingomyelinase-like phosphodiesterase 3b [Elysia marginata]